MRESHIGSELKEMAQEVMRFGERCVQAGREWLNERRDDMNNRYEGRHDYRSDYEQGRGQHDFSSRPGREQTEQSEYGSRQYGQEATSRRGRGEYYGSQFDDRLQGSGRWSEDRGGWDYEGGPERYGSAGYGPESQRQVQQAGRQHGQYGQYGGQREYGSYGSATSDYYPGRQGFGAQEAFGTEYGSYDRNEGYGEGSGYARPSQTRFGEQRYGSSNVYGGQSAAYGGRGVLRSQDYLEDRGLSDYGGRELGTQQQGSRSSGRYGTEPGQYGYGGYGTRGFRGVGPKNYSRSDERIAEEINERLTDDDDLDASDITVSSANGKVTLEGNVDQRWMKHRAEDIADSCLGVKEVDNRIQVNAGRTMAQSASEKASIRPGTTTSTSGTTGTTGTTAGGTTPH